jgi:hypothetical protein
MVWGQGLSPEQVIDPKMAYQGPWLPGDYTRQEFTDEWNGCRLEDANLAHWHGSRNGMAKLNLMQSINQDLNIPDTPVVNRPTRTMDISHYP